MYPETDTISIVAGGHSVSRVDPAKIPGLIVAVNDSALRLPRRDIAVSMDRLWIEHRWAELRALGVETHFRKGAAKNLAPPLPAWLNLFDCDHTSAELSDEAGVLNGENSGYCAVNLAYQRRPRELYLFGFDMAAGPKAERYWYPPYPWVKPGKDTSRGKYPAWAMSFELAARALARAGIAAYVVGPSRIAALPKLGLERFQ